MRSASVIVESRWATTITVVDAATDWTVSRRAASLRASSWEVASSSRSTPGRRSSSARDRDPLSFAAGELHAAVANLGPQPLGQCCDERVEPSRAQHCGHIRVGCLGRAVHEVLV